MLLLGGFGIVCIDPDPRLSFYVAVSTGVLPSVK